jgi:hypothetical protein
VARSQSIFLFHHLLVYLGGMLLVQVNLPKVVEFPLLIAGVLAGVVFIHALLMRVPLLRILFAGRAICKPVAIDLAGHQPPAANAATING